MSEEANQVSVPQPPTPRPGRNRWLTILLAGILIFGLGAGSVYFTWLRPANEANRSLSTQIESAEAELQALRPLVSENVSLQAEARQAEMRLLALSALADVNSARVAMALGNPSEARMPILLADGKLAKLGTELAGEQAESVSAIRDRLTLARGEIETDAFAAQRDLEVVANDLAKLVKALETD
jgi:hypothetical protein